MRVIHIALVVLFAGAILLFALQNIRSVTVSFLAFEAGAPLALVVLIVYLLGMATGGSVVSFLRRSIRAARGGDG